VRWIVRGGILLAGLLAVTALAWMLFLRTVVQHELRVITGFDFRVDVLAVNPFTGNILVRGLSASNPAAYPSPGFATVREIRARVNLFSWACSDTVVIDELDLDSESIQIVRVSAVKSNAGDFMAAFGAPTSAGQAAPTPTRHKKYVVKAMHIRLDKLVIADYTGRKPDVVTYELNINHDYTNVTDTHSLLTPDVVKSLHALALRHDVSELLPGEFGTLLAVGVGGVAAVESTVVGATKKTGEAVKGLFDKLEQKPKP
jgi:hypothetical protein